MSCRLSVNINKVATIRNARGGNVPDLIQFAKDAEEYGAQGITVHPRPDERHIRYKDVRELRPILRSEFNIEGYPSEPFLELVEEVIPDQVTLVPDPPDVLTSNAGWAVGKNLDFLTEVISRLGEKGIRTSIFLEPDPKQVILALKTGVDRIELYTESYAQLYSESPKRAIAPFKVAAAIAEELQIGLNAGHDLNLVNLRYLAEEIPYLNEVSIGHALISDALYFGIENAIQMYLRELRKASNQNA